MKPQNIFKVRHDGKEFFFPKEVVGLYFDLDGDAASMTFRSDQMRDLFIALDRYNEVRARLGLTLWDDKDVRDGLRTPLAVALEGATH